jgi:hypothetical protein
VSQRGLAGPVRAYQEQHASARLEANPLKNLKRYKTVMHILNMEHVDVTLHLE